MFLRNGKFRPFGNTAVCLSNSLEGAKSHLDYLISKAGITHDEFIHMYKEAEVIRDNKDKLWNDSIEKFGTTHESWYCMVYNKLMFRSVK